MKIAVVGAGAIGGLIGATLARAGEPVILLARGPHLLAMRKSGVQIRGAIELSAHPPVTGDPEDIGLADAVLLTVKAHSLTQVAPSLGRVVRPGTPTVSLQNGIPWWYFGPPGTRRLKSLDPNGVIESNFPFSDLIGGVIYCGASISQPGIIEVFEPPRILIGEPGRTESNRCAEMAEILNHAGLNSRVAPDIRREVWRKLMGNLAFNPISALTGATIKQILDCPETRALVTAVMREAETVAGRLGIALDVSIEQRLAGAAKLGNHKTSMLQDAEAGRPLELEAIAGAVLEIADEMQIPIPCTQATYSCAKLMAGLASLDQPM